VEVAAAVASAEAVAQVGVLAASGCCPSLCRSEDNFSSSSQASYCWSLTCSIQFTTSPIRAS
jgi:hypothetical protein